jgi:uncharacterized membrane protein YozB (DUF420 family)
MIELRHLPTVNAALNSVAFVLLLSGYFFIRRGQISAHARCMVSAFCVSVLFLGSYLTYWALGEEKKFGGQGWIRPVYFLILISHVLLAATVPFLASYTLYQAARGRLVRHRRIARVTLPIWAYVSATGLIVYLLLFVIYGPAGTPAESSLPAPLP